MKLTPEIIGGFVGSVLAPRFESATATPDFHKELWGYACADSQYVAIAAPRGHAKSTAGTLAYGLAELLFRTSVYCIIVSDTEAQAIQFLDSMKKELLENENLIELFGISKNDKNEVVFVRDTQSDIIVKFQDGHLFKVQAKGAEQRLRGLNWNGTRPDLIIVDDLENDELVMNSERRDKLRRWFRGALLPALSPKGKIRMWGTILHEDSQLNRLMPKDYGKYTVNTGLKQYEDHPQGKIRGAWLSVKYQAHNDDFSQILWPSRFPEEYWRLKRAEHFRDGALDIYSQEYLNRPIDESVAYFKRGDLLPITEEDKKKRVVYYATADLAISQDRRADYSVFLVAGVDNDRIIQVKHIVRDRFDGREIVECMIGLQRMYNLEAFGVEEMMISKSIGPFLREEMLKTGVFLNLIQLKHSGKDKVQRARSIQARMRTKAVKFDKEADWYPTLEDELLKFPRGTHDDQADTLAYMGLLLDSIVEAPTDKEAEDEEAAIEFNRTGLSDTKDVHTGY